MTDIGNTATSPQGLGPSVDLPTEEDMNKVRSIFERGVNAIVEASSLHTQVQELSNQLDGLRGEIEKVRQQNAWLDEQLLRIRTERDEAIRKGNESFEAARVSESKVTSLLQELDKANSEITRMDTNVRELLKERDDAQYKVMELTEKYEKLHAKLERFLALADEIDPPEEPHLVSPQYPTVTSHLEDLPKQVIQDASTEWDPITQSYRTRVG